MGFGRFGIWDLGFWIGPFELAATSLELSTFNFRLSTGSSDSRLLTPARSQSEAPGRAPDSRSTVAAVSKAHRTPNAALAHLHRRPEGFICSLRRRHAGRSCPPP